MTVFAEIEASTITSSSGRQGLSLGNLLLSLDDEGNPVIFLNGWQTEIPRPTEFNPVTWPQPGLFEMRSQTIIYHFYRDIDCGVTLVYSFQGRDARGVLGRFATKIHLHPNKMTDGVWYTMGKSHFIKSWKPFFNYALVFISGVIACLAIVYGVPILLRR